LDASGSYHRCFLLLLLVLASAFVHCREEGVFMVDGAVSQIILQIVDTLKHSSMWR
jgi:hypothetical protein